MILTPPGTSATETANAPWTACRMALPASSLVSRIASSWQGCSAPRRAVTNARAAFTSEGTAANGWL
ncbi:hypothetical protein ABGB17_25980 [Sphaerisporangium sp. B11E5]|uniref:hypothetical protein n=1 Tax=Sphaerisporangium sp. B11E5 TaxID=3153563 RepID=UPI00325F3E1B